MNLENKVRADVFERLSLASCDDELKRSLRNDEQTEYFIRKLTLDLHSVKKLTPLARKNAVYSMTDFYINLKKQKANEQLMSDAQKSVLNSEVKKAEAFDRAVETGIADEVLEDVQ